MPVQGINEISGDHGLAQCSIKLCLLGLKPFSVTSPQGITKAHGKWWRQNKLPLLGALWLGEEGDQASSAVPSSGNKVRLCLLLKCGGEISAS